ncbi:MAG TPA: class I SAM-dependent methyltransferase [Nitrospirales bacterium]|jgi:ubiquinone/menaquinone biosynthesis C-methylase UbiE
MSNTEQVKADFDEIAGLVDSGASGTDRYDALLLSLVPPNASSVLDIGCGLGRLTQALAVGNREVVGVDLSPIMIKRARLTGQSDRVSFLEGDFLALDFRGRMFDCVVSAAALHHMNYDIALSRMVDLTRPGGRLLIQDLRRDSSLTDSIAAYSALAQTAFTRLVRTGRPRPARLVREAWARHGAKEVYLSLREARELADRHLPGARVLNHWLWRYTIVWDKPPAV